MDDELMQLCKEVYKRTGREAQGTAYKRFTTSEDWTVAYDGVHRTVAQWFYLYTSDYLLEKMPVNTTLQHQENKWVAQVMGETSVFSADTPLKALLKLTIALHDTNQLPTPDTNERKGE